MNYAIVVYEKLGPTLLYSNRKVASLDPENDIQIGERQLARLVAAKKKEQEKDPNCFNPTGYPVETNGLTIDRVLIRSMKDILFKS